MSTRKTNKKEVYPILKDLKIDEYSDINNLNFAWSQKFEELQARSQAAFEELKKNQELEYKKLFSQYQENVENVKPSSMFLKLQKEEEGLVKLRKFKEAEVVRKKKEAQRKLDMKKSGKNKENTFRCLEKNENKNILMN